MKIKIKGYRNLENLDYQIIDNKINMLFGISGSGKSSIAKALKMEDIEFNKKVDYEGNVEITLEEIKPNPQDILLFDDSCDKFIFDERNENVFDIFVDNDAEMKKLQDEVDKQLQNLDSEIKNSQLAFEESSELVKKFGSKLTSNNEFKKNAKIKTIIKSVSDNKTSRCFKEFNSMDSQKVNWYLTGIDYIEDNNCPFCEKKLSKPKIEKYERMKLINNKSVDLVRENKVKIEKQFSSNFKMTPKGFKELEAAMVRNAMANQDYQKIVEFSEKIKCGNMIKPEQIEISDGLKEFYPELFKQARLVNKRIDSLIKISTKAKRETKELLMRRVSRVNSQIEKLGIPYKIEAEYYRSTITSYKLVHVNENKKIDRKHSLSSGEKNLISLLFFILDAAKKNTKLIIIDDPVSSFDSYRRKIVMEIIKDTLIGKTVLILSHDSIFAKYACFCTRGANRNPFGKISYFDNVNGLSEIKNITKDDFGEFLEYVENHLKGITDYYQKIINLRLLYEKSHSAIEYGYLSAILHLRTKIEVDEQLKKRGVKEQDVIERINHRYNVVLPPYEGPISKSDIKDTNYTILEKAVVLREIFKSNKSVMKKIKPELDNVVHLNDRLDICLDPYKYSFISPYTLKVINDCFSKM